MSKETKEIQKIDETLSVKPKLSKKEENLQSQIRRIERRTSQEMVCCAIILATGNKIIFKKPRQHKKARPFLLINKIFNDKKVLFDVNRLSANEEDYSMTESIDNDEINQKDENAKVTKKSKKCENENSANSAKLKNDLPSENEMKNEENDLKEMKQLNEEKEDKFDKLPKLPIMMKEKEEKEEMKMKGKRGRKSKKEKEEMKQNEMKEKKLAKESENENEKVNENEKQVETKDEKEKKMEEEQIENKTNEIKVEEKEKVKNDLFDVSKDEKEKKMEEEQIEPKENEMKQKIRKTIKYLKPLKVIDRKELETKENEMKEKEKVNGSKKTKIYKEELTSLTMEELVSIVSKDRRITLKTKERKTEQKNTKFPWINWIKIYGVKFEREKICEIGLSMLNFVANVKSAPENEFVIDYEQFMNIITIDERDYIKQFFELLAGLRSGELFMFSRQESKGIKDGKEKKETKDEKEIENEKVIHNPLIKKEDEKDEDCIFEKMEEEEK